MLDGLRRYSMGIVFCTWPNVSGIGESGQRLPTKGHKREVLEVKRDQGTERSSRSGGNSGEQRWRVSGGAGKEQKRRIWKYSQTA